MDNRKFPHNPRAEKDEKMYVFVNEDPSGPSGRRNQAGADLESFKDRIIELWMDKTVSMKEMMKIMKADHGIVAT